MPTDSLRAVRLPITNRLHCGADSAKALLRSYGDHMLGGRADWLGRPWFWVAAVVLVAAVAASASAAGSPHENRVDSLRYRDDAFYLEIEPEGDFRERRWGRSDDGGATWTVVNREDLPPVRTWGNLPNTQCAQDGACYRRNQEGYVLEREDATGNWVVEYRSGDLINTVAINPANGAQAVAMVGWTTVVSRRPDGAWVGVDVVAATGPPQWQADLLRILRNPLTILVIGIALTVAGLGLSQPSRLRTAWIIGNLGATWLLIQWTPTSGVIGWILAIWLVLALGGLAAVRVHGRRRRADDEVLR